ncbi:hypothetical protein IMX26_03620 [Clostridium sp. 'deep sea']|uniref:hypothetical protein n=1 Tax=Clostridium sp. 'deep sea' TaxID=2779445 RepID=UPI001896594A|nr:hypothetical protein [Clostridium sp. 'deep sea']QOR35919.1 hypothetical protein IMX26_03620 [Clostridium sp. 'deep sea']
MKNIVTSIYQSQQRSIESILTSKASIVQNNRGSLLQIPGILCDKKNNNCQMYKLNFMPKASFARTTTCSALQLLTDVPYSYKGGEQLITSLLWTSSFKDHFIDAFVTIVYKENDLFTLNKTTNASLLIPVHKKVEQFDVELTLFNFGVLHAYANAITDLLTQPNLELWDERFAGVITIK